VLSNACGENPQLFHEAAEIFRSCPQKLFRKSVRNLCLFFPRIDDNGITIETPAFSSWRSPKHECTNNAAVFSPGFIFKEKLNYIKRNGCTSHDNTLPNYFYLKDSFNGYLNG